MNYNGLESIEKIELFKVAVELRRDYIKENDAHIFTTFKEYAEAVKQCVEDLAKIL